MKTTTKIRRVIGKRYERWQTSCFGRKQGFFDIFNQEGILVSRTLYKTYRKNESEYPKYDNYDAINVDKIKNIPLDHKGHIGVPITFLDKYNPEQFEILGLTSGRDEFEAIPTKKYKNPKQINVDGSMTNGSKANTRATLIFDKKPRGIHYIADNVNGYLSILYARIIIKHKKL